MLWIIKINFFTQKIENYPQEIEIKEGYWSIEKSGESDFLRVSGLF
jgi:hypothetical protein